MRALCLASLLILLVPGLAEARRTATFSYPYSRVWASAVRMLRIDYSSPITEKDKDNGYLLFEFVHLEKQHPGSVEMIRRGKQQPEQVEVVIQVPAMPSYVEQMLLDRLGRKLSTEYGPPPKKRPPEDKKPDEDAPPEAPDEGEPRAPDDEEVPDEPGSDDQPDRESEP